MDEIKQICEMIKTIKQDCICFVDNCYGEFVDTLEPTAAGAVYGLYILGLYYPINWSERHIAYAAGLGTFSIFVIFYFQCAG
uniref:methionine gamma-lyase family protein n=1 Tax=Massilibacillus massiliensis TaxID=1806837 RepID=UPI003898E0B9